MWHARLALVFAVVAGGCGPYGCLLSPPRPDLLGPDGGPCRVADRRFDRLLVPGREAQLRLGLTEACYNPSRAALDLPTSVSVDVVDPEGQPSPHFTSQPFQVGSPAEFENLVEVVFTPTRPGTYRIRAQFEPGIGATDQLIEAVEERFDAGFRDVLWIPPSACRSFQVMSTGTVACTGGFSRFMDFGTSDGVHMKAQAFAYNEEALWRLVAVSGGSSIVERLVSDGGFYVTHSFADTSSTTGALAADGRSVWLLGGLVAPRVGTVAARRLTPLDDGGLLVDTIRMAGSAVNGIVAGPGGSLAVVTNTSGMRLDALSIEHGIQLLRDSKIVTLVGISSATVWLLMEPEGMALAGLFGGLSNDLLAVTRVGDGTETRRLMLAYRAPGDLNGILAGVPLIFMSQAVGPTAPDIAVPRLDASGIRLERYFPGEGFGPVYAASTDHVFSLSLDGGTLRVIDRHR